MKCPNENCGAEIERENAKFCSKCRQKLPRKAEFIVCNGKDENGERCAEKIKVDEQYCANCSREVAQDEFFIVNCQKCGEYCLASNKMCIQCLQTDISENAKEKSDAIVTEQVQRPTGSTVTCEHCAKIQLGHWSFCLNCGKNHPFKPNDQGAIDETEDQILTLRKKYDAKDRRFPDRGDTEEPLETQSQRATLYFDDEFITDMIYDLGSDEVDDDILITMEEAIVIQMIFDNDKSTKTNSTAIKNVNDLSPSTSANAATAQNSLDQSKSKKETVAAIQRALGLHRLTESDVVVNQTVTHQAKFGTNQKRSGQETATAIHRVTDQDNVATVQKSVGHTNAATNQKIPDQTWIAAIQKLALLANADTCSNILDPGEVERFRKVLDQCGYSELMEILENSNNAWRDSTIKIAITGKSGTGKSSLINALCGRKDDEPGAAHTDCVETTMEPTPYPHPLNKNLVIWDLPGVGTHKFPKEKYIEDARFDTYDFIILVSCTRYTEEDTWLAEQITSRFPGTNLIFVRTKVDNDLEGKKRGRKVPMLEDELKKVFTTIKQDCFEKLKTAKIENPRVFLVDNHDQTKFEFGKFADILVDNVSVLKKDALVITISSFTQNIVAAKYELSKKRQKNISKQAAVAAVKSNRDKGERLEMEILKSEVMLYKQQFGIDTTSLDIVAHRFGLDIEEVYAKMDSDTHVILRNFEQYYIEHDKIDPSHYYSVPWISYHNKMKDYQIQCVRVLKSLLRLCVKENKTLQKNLAVWSFMPN